VVLLLLAAAGLLCGAGAASAHAVLVSTDPVEGSVVAARPGRVSLVFGEAVQLPPNAVRVFDPDGIEVDDQRAHLTSADGRAVGIGLLPGAARGTYTVAWRVISADTHPVSGAFTFSVGHPSATAPATATGGSPAVGLLYGITRFLGYLGYAAMVGAGAFLLVCWPPGCRSSTSARVAAFGWATVVLASSATLVLQGPYGNGTGLAGIFEPGATATTLALPLGGALVVRMLLLTAAAGYLGLLGRQLPAATPRRRRWLTGIGAMLAGGLAATWAVSGHAGVGPGAELALPLDIAHLIAMAVWLGGLLTLAAELFRAPAETLHRGAAVGRFSTTASVCVAVVAASGVYQSWRQLGDWAAFLDTAYGRILLAKIVAVGALLTVAGFARRAVRTGDAAPLLRRAVLVEAVVGGVVLALTATLVNAEPAREERAEFRGTHVAGTVPVAPASGYRALPFHTGGPGGDGTLDVRLSPGRGGPNSIDVTVLGAGGAPRDVPELGVELSLPDRKLGPLRAAVRRQSQGRYQASAQIPFPGAWQVGLTVRTSDIDETTVWLPVTVGP
jgi:copper transport protein